LSQSAAGSAQLAQEQKLPSTCFSENRRRIQREDHDLLTGERADVVVQAENLGAGDVPNDRFQERPPRFNL